MALQSDSRGATALAGLAAFISLLFLRACNFNYPTVSQACEFEVENEEDHSDDEDSTNTARPDGLLQDQDKLRKRFICRFVRVCAAERNGDFVAATVLKETEGDAHVDVWLARNNGFGANVWERGNVEEEEWGRLWRWVVRKNVTNMMETNKLVLML